MLLVIEEAVDRKAADQKKNLKEAKDKIFLSKLIAQNPDVRSRDFLLKKVEFCWMSDYLRLGKLVASHGLKGELVLKHELGKKSALKNLKTVFIEEKKNNFLPWFISASRVKNEEETYIKFEGVDVRETAVKLTQKNVWVTEEEFKKLAAKSSPVNLLGYSVVSEKNILGKILEVIEQPHQLLFKLEINNKEALIPMNENTLKKIDHKKKEVIVELPEGLLDIYLT